MNTIFNLTVEDFDKQSHRVQYRLTENTVAHRWYKKILHLHRVPLCKHYTQRREQVTLSDLYELITHGITKLNKTIDLKYQVKDTYTQEDCNNLHDLTISNQYNYHSDIREIFHKLHRNIHSLEAKLKNINVNSIYAGWGEKEGLLETKFDKLPYKLYQSHCPGYLYLNWSEFGKTPYRYWKDQESDNLEYFFKTCQPHKTFRTQFTLALSNWPESFPQEFYSWFDQYQDKWKLKYNTEWTPLHEWGGVPLAQPLTDINWAQINTVISIHPDTD
jgi:hypothetical protein